MDIPRHQMLRRRTGLLLVWLYSMWERPWVQLRMDSLPLRLHWMIPAEDIPCSRVLSVFTSTLMTVDREDVLYCTLGTGWIWLGNGVGWLMLRIEAVLCHWGFNTRCRQTHLTQLIWWLSHFSLLTLIKRRPAHPTLIIVSHTHLLTDDPPWRTPYLNASVLVHPITSPGFMYPDVMFCIGFWWWPLFRVWEKRSKPILIISEDVLTSTVV